MLNLLQRVAFLLTIALAAACDREAAQTPATPAPPAAAPTTYDVEALMTALAETIDRENVILQKAVTDWKSVDATDHRALLAAWEDRRRIGDEIKAMLQANPHWVQSTCQWFQARVISPQERYLKLRHHLMQEQDTPDGPHRLRQLLFAACGSIEVTRRYTDFQLNHPGAPGNLYIMCVKFGVIDES